MGITILLADSAVGVRQIERTLLEKEPDIEVVGEAA
jgi:DNA-binding NarL/FixJ family response regulator